MPQDEDDEGLDTEEAEREWVEHGMVIQKALREVDPPAFAGRDTWRSRVYEEVELGILRKSLLKYRLSVRATDMNANNCMITA